MRKKGLVPDEVTYNTLLKLCVRGNDMKGANEVSFIISVYFLTFFISCSSISFFFTRNHTFYGKTDSSYQSHLRYLLLSALSHFLFHLITFPLYSFLLSIYLSISLSLLLSVFLSFSLFIV